MKWLQPPPSLHERLYAFYFMRSGWRQDKVILEGDDLLAVRGQSQLVGYQSEVNAILKRDARSLLHPLKCNEDGMFMDGNSRLITSDMNSVRLALGRFTAYWRAKCTIGPKKCNVRFSTCSSKCADKAIFFCDVQWTIYDYYDFNWWEPYGWTGRPFHIFGYWTTATGGTVRRCK